MRLRVRRGFRRRKRRRKYGRRIYSLRPDSRANTGIQNPVNARTVKRRQDPVVSAVERTEQITQWETERTQARRNRGLTNKQLLEVQAKPRTPENLAEIARLRETADKLKSVEASA